VSISIKDSKVMIFHCLIMDQVDAKSIGKNYEIRGGRAVFPIFWEDYFQAITWPTST
jgi:hypothetical protein